MGKYKNKFKHMNKQVDDYVPVGREEDLNRKIEELNLSKHCYDALKAGKIVTLRDLCVQCMSRMYRIQNIGKKDCLEIKAKLKKFNLDFRPEEENPYSKKNKNQDNNEKPTQLNVRFSIFNDKDLAKFIVGKREREVINWGDEPVKKPEVIKFCRNGKWGYKNQKGVVVIQPIYDEAYQFSEEMACVEKGQKLGYIDLQGNQVVDFIYDCASSFYEGLACVTKDDKTGYIDKTGKYVFEPIYDRGTPFANGKAMIKKDDKWGVLDKEGNIYWK